MITYIIFIAIIDNKRSLQSKVLPDRPNPPRPWLHFTPVVSCIIFIPIINNTRSLQLKVLPDRPSPPPLIRFYTCCYLCHPPLITSQAILFVIHPSRWSEWSETLQDILREVFVNANSYWFRNHLFPTLIQSRFSSWYTYKVKTFLPPREILWIPKYCFIRDVIILNKRPLHWCDIYHRFRWFRRSWLFV